MYFTSGRVPVSRSSFTGLRQINRLFDEALNVIGENAENDGTLGSAWVPACDVFEGHDVLKIVMEVPGVASEDIKLSLENNQLSIRGEKRQAAEEHNERVHRYERSYGNFERVFTLPVTVDADRIEARAEHGVLTVMLPKVERARPREIPVTTG